MNRPIGVFDSGIGGLTVLKELKKALPNENIVYFGDTARVPYGTKSKETIVKFSIQNALFLLKSKVKIIVVACNSSSSVSIPFLTQCLKMPVLGVIKAGAKEAVRLSKSRRIGVIGTRATIKSGAYEQEIKKINPKAKVFAKACPLFVPLVEEGLINDKITYDVAKKYLKPLRNKKIDTLILGCTHYPLLNNVIRKVMGPKIKIVDSARQAALETRDVLSSRDMARQKKSKPDYRFYVSDEPELFKKVGERFLGSRIGRVRKADSDV